MKSRALAGCCGKKWYGYSGSRDSGKRTGNRILRKDLVSILVISF
jgi:hypothetical protein